MIPILYPSTETTFENNGLGGLPDAISCVVTEQRNTQGGYYLEMEYPVDGLHFDLLAPERIIYAAPSMGNTPQPFRISRITRPINGIVHIEAPHVSAELQKIVTYGRMRAYTVWGLWSDFKGVATNIGQACPFTISSNFNLTEAINFWFDEPITMASLLMGMEGSMLDKIGGEIEFDKWNVVYNTQRGVDSGLEIRYGVNMSDLEAETDASELVTAVIPYWKGTVNDTDTVVIGDMCSASNASAYAYVRCVPLDVTQQFEETDTQPTKADVTAKGQAFINSTSRRLLQTSIRVSYEPTTSGIGERRINLCDTVRVVYPDLNVSSISKVVETRFNVLTERYDELTIGTIRNNIVDTIAGLVSGGASYSGGGSSGGGSSAVTSVNGMVGDVVLNATSVGALPSTYTAPVTSVNGMTGDVVVSGGGGGAVDSVNGQTGVVVLTASDVGAVATESGKGLSTNDFTTAEKNKLSGIAAGAEVNVQADWNQTDNTAADYIKNKPSGFSGDEVLYTAQSKTNGEKLQARRNIGMLSPFVTFLYASSNLQSVDGVLTGNQIVSKYGLSSVQNMSGMFAIDINNYKAYYLDSFDYDHGTVVFRRKEGNEYKLLTISGDSTVVTESTESAVGVNVFYYLDGTTVKSAETNLAVTSQQIYNETIRNGFAPIIYVDEHSERLQFHFYSLDSGGTNFRTVDGVQEIRVFLGSSTVSRSFVNPYSVYAVYDSANSKYVLKKGSALSFENVTYTDLSNHVRNVWMNSQLPIHKLTLSDGYMEFRFIDMQVANGGVSVVQWLVQAGSQTGVSVTRDTI